MKKLYLVFCLAMALAMSFMFTGCNDTVKVEDDQYSYVSIKINPQADFVIKNGFVKAVIGINEDAELLLSDVNLTDKPIDDAVEEFVGLAVEAGYIDVERQDNEITYAVACGGGMTGDEIGLIICNRINTLLDRNNIEVTVKPGLLDRQRAGLISEYKEDAKSDWIFAATSALEIFPELDIREINSLDTGGIIELIYQKTFDGVISAQLRQGFAREIATLLESEEFASFAAYQGGIRNPFYQPEGLEPYEGEPIDDLLDNEHKLISAQFKNRLQIIKQQFMLDTGRINQLLQEQKGGLIEEYRPILEQHHNKVSSTKKP